jgi:Tfp pilus assembly protein PilF
MGMLDHMDGDLPGAQRHYRIALSQRPSWADAHARMAEVCREMNALPAALRHYRMAEELGFSNAGFLFNYGIALARAGRNAAAVEVWHRALAQDPPPALAGRIRANIEGLRKKER